MPIPSPAALAVLRCPACKGDLDFADERVTCLGCGLVYPVDNGIPVLLADAAVRPAPEA